MIRTSFILALAAFLVLSAPAQLVIGDIGVTGFIFTGPQAVTILHANGTSSVYPLTGVSGIIHAIEYDAPQSSFIIGGAGFLGRVAISGGIATYTPISNAVSLVSQVSFDGADLVVFDGGISQVLRIHSVTGAITPITSGAQPWGIDMTAGCRDPNTGDLYVGGNNAIWRIPSGSSTAALFASGWTGGSSFVSGLLVDPFSLQLVATLLTVNRLVRIDGLGTLTNICPPGSVSGPNAVGLDPAGDFVVAGAFGLTYRVANAGGSPTNIGTAAGFVGAATGVAPLYPAFDLTAAPLGIGGLTISVTGIPAGTTEGFTVASFDVSLPVGQGPIFGFSPDALSFALVLAFPSPSQGNVVHWTWPVAFPDYPATGFSAPPGTLAPGTTVDLLVVAVNSGFYLRAAPVERLTVN